MPAPLHHSTTENEHETLQDHKLNFNLELHRRPVHFPQNWAKNCYVIELTQR